MLLWRLESAGEMMAPPCEVMNESWILPRERRSGRSAAASAKNIKGGLWAQKEAHLAPRYREAGYIRPFATPSILDARSQQRAAALALALASAVAMHLWAAAFHGNDNSL